MVDIQICISFWGTNNDLLSSAAHAALLVLGRAQVAPSTVLIVAEEATNLVVSSKPTDTKNFSYKATCTRQTDTAHRNKDKLF